MIVSLAGYPPAWILELLGGFSDQMKGIDGVGGRKSQGFSRWLSVTGRAVALAFPLIYGAFGCLLNAWWTLARASNHSARRGNDNGSRKPCSLVSTLFTLTPPPPPSCCHSLPIYTSTPLLACYVHKNSLQIASWTSTHMVSKDGTAAMNHNVQPYFLQAKGSSNITTYTWDEFLFG